MVSCVSVAFSLVCADSIVNIQEIYSSEVYDINRHNIAWDTDRNTRFNATGGSPQSFQIATPPNWPQSILSVPDGLNNESLIVWFRISAFPWFRKFYGRLMRNGNFTDMPVSTYSISIIYCILTWELDLHCMSHCFCLFCTSLNCGMCLNIP